MKSGNVTIGAEAGVSGGVTMSDLGTIWEVQSSGMSIGQGGTGTFTLNAGAHLTFNSGTLFAVGLNSGSHGTLTCDTASVDATAALVAIGQAKGGAGLVNLTDSDFLVGHDFTVGDSGSGAFNFTGSSAVSVSGTSTKFIIGNAAGSAGSIFGSGSLMVAGPMTIGASGSGFLGSDGGVLESTNAGGLLVGAKAEGGG